MFAADSFMVSKRHERGSLESVPVLVRFRPRGEQLGSSCHGQVCSPWRRVASETWSKFQNFGKVNFSRSELFLGDRGRVGGAEASGVNRSRLALSGKKLFPWKCENGWFFFLL